MPAPKPTHYDDLAVALNHAWALMQDGATKRESPLRRAVLATRALTGTAAARTVILRLVDRDRRTIRVYTDARSAKVEEIRAEPRVQVLFHHPAEQIQLRVGGTAIVRTGDQQDHAAWDATVPPVRRASMGDQAPGTPADAATSGFPEEFARRLPTKEESEAAFENFAVVEVAIERIEWLYLNPDGHRRAVFTWPGGTLKAGWVVP